MGRTTGSVLAEDDPVHAFYERHPYPPPVRGLDGERRAWRDPDRRRADYHLFWPRTPFREDEEILVAGCGTSQAAKYAVRHAAANVTGIDVSAAGLDHTRQLAQRYGLRNLALFQLPIERVHELGRTFDRIVCTGVLHHLRDPDAGLSALRSVLKPDGAMLLMVYAPFGRVGIHMLQDYCHRVGVGTSAEEIRDLVAVLEALPRHHPLSYLLRDSLDFGRTDALADALLNPRERAYSVSQLFEFITRSSLTFGRWYRQAAYLPQCGAPASTPHGERLARLPVPEAYAAVELFRGTTARHSVIVYRDDRPEDHWQMRFDDAAWPGFVPLRLPHTVIIEDRLPPGAAAVLINQSHSHPDLILPVQSWQRHVYEAVDGVRTVAEIARLSSIDLDDATQREHIRTFFQRLWWYDHVVFDASAT